MRIGIDVDLTTLQSDVAWWNWLRKMCGGQYEDVELWSLHRDNKEIDYNLSVYFPKPINSNVCVFDFWRNEGVYDMIDPVVGAVKNIKKLYKMGHSIVFITHNKGNGSRSKYNCLKRLFRDIEFDYVVTKEKHLVNIDVLVDDRNNFLNICADNACVIKINTPYTQSEKLKDEDSTIICDNWNEITETICLL